MSWITRKQNIMDEIMNSIRSADKLNVKVVKDKLLAQISIKHGTARKKGLEYMKDLISAQLVRESFDREGSYYSLVKKEIDI